MPHHTYPSRAFTFHTWYDVVERRQGAAFVGYYFVHVVLGDAQVDTANFRDHQREASGSGDAAHGALDHFVGFQTEL